MKKVFTRLWFWLVWAVIGLLIDEYIKEGYLFKLEDIFNANITHEKIIVSLIILLITIMIRKKRKGSDS